MYIKHERPYQYLQKFMVEIITISRVKSKQILIRLPLDRVHVYINKRNILFLLRSSLFVTLLWGTEMPRKEKTGYRTKDWISLMQVSSVKDFRQFSMIHSDAI